MVNNGFFNLMIKKNNRANSSKQASKTSSFAQQQNAIKKSLYEDEDLQDNQEENEDEEDPLLKLKTFQTKLATKAPSLSQKQSSTQSPSPKKNNRFQEEEEDNEDEEDDDEEEEEEEEEEVVPKHKFARPQFIQKQDSKSTGKDNSNTMESLKNLQAQFQGQESKSLSETNKNKAPVQEEDKEEKMRKQREKYENMYHIKDTPSQPQERITVANFLDAPLSKPDLTKDTKKSQDEDQSQNNEDRPTHSLQKQEQKLSLADEYQKQIRNKKQQEDEKKKAEELENIGKLRHKLQEENAAHQAVEEQKRQQAEQNMKEEEHKQNNKPSLEEILHKKQSDLPQARPNQDNEMKKGSSKPRLNDNSPHFETKEIQVKQDDENQIHKRQAQVSFVQTQMKQQEQQQFHDSPNLKYREQYNQNQEDDDDEDEDSSDDNDENSSDDDENSSNDDDENSSDEDEQQQQPQPIIHKPEQKYHREQIEVEEPDENFTQQNQNYQEDIDEEDEQEDDEENDESDEDESEEEIIPVQQFRGKQQNQKVIEKEPKNDDKFKFLLPKQGKNNIPQQKTPQQQKHQNNEEHYFQLPEEKQEKKNRNTASCDDEIAGQACSLCETNQVFNLDSIEWTSKQVPKQNQKENQQLLDFLQKLLGESSLFISFSEGSHMCIVGEKFTKQVPIDFLLKQFTGNGLDFYQNDNQLLEIPQQFQPSYLQVEAKFEPSKRVFVFKNFLVKAPYQNELKYSKNGSFKMREISFAQRQFQISYDGFANQKKQFHYEQRNGGEKTEMVLKDLILPNDNAIVSFLAEKYLGGEFKQQVKNFESEGFHGNLQINTIKTDNHIALSFNLFKQE